MKTATKNQVSEAVNDWIDKSPGRTASQLATLADVSPAHISKIRNRQYTIKVGDHDSPIGPAVFNKLIETLGLQMQAAGHWDTPNYKLITNVCRSAQSKAQRILLVGPTGLGKTYTLERYALEHDKVLYLKVTGTMSPKDMLEEICRKLHIRRDLRGNRSRMMAIQQKVTATRGWLIIIDEAEYLKNTLFHLVKEIADFTERRSGMILSGMDLDLKISAMADRHKAGFPQLRRRFFPNRVSLSEIQPDEIRKLATEAGITDTSVINVLKRKVFDYDALGQYITSILEVQERSGELITGQQAVELFDLNF